MQQRIWSISFLGVALTLSLIGTLFVLTASSAQSLRLYGDQFVISSNHLLGLALALGVGGVGLCIPSKWWLDKTKLMYLLGLALLILVLIPGIGVKLNGARRWLLIGGFQLQPIELFKFAFISYQASWLAKKPSLAAFLGTTTIPALLLLAQPDLGSLLVLVSISAGMYFLSGAPLKRVGILAISAVALLSLLILTSSYRIERMKSFFNPTQDLLGANFQVHQMTLALGRGGMMGEGLGNSQQKYLYIPEASTDAIFAIVSEELGFIGGSVILLLFMSYQFIGFRIALSLQKAPQKSLIVYGGLIWIGVQALLNLGAVVVLIPLTGIPLPFFSYGRTSQIMVWFITGVIARLGLES